MKRILPIAILGIILGLIYGVYSARQGAPASVPLADLPPQQQQERRAQAQKLVEQAQQIARDAQRREKKPFELRATQDEINTLLQDRLKMQNLPVENLGITLSTGQITATGTAKYNGLSVPVALNATPQVEAGELKLTVDSLSLGGFPAPSEWKNKTQKAIGDGLKNLFQSKNGARLESVEVQPGVMILRGQTG